ncbi:MAG: hypothetical protein ABF743_09575 [Schleiferilactobacillus perolens]|uniref:hypothetical protein n=1 Tax=Schleiferilactobacillus perolens TaxID=100468 RepID=UPI0039EBDBEB
MTKDRAEVEQRRKAQGITSMYFNRYLAIRYLNAIFLFANLYWLILMVGTRQTLWMWPLALLLGVTAVTVEQVRKYWDRSNRLPITRITYFFQSASNALALIFVAAGKLQWVFPFMSAKSVPTVLIVLGLGLLIAVFIEYKTYKIEHDKDRRYLRNMKNYQESLQ